MILKMKEKNYVFLSSANGASRRYGVKNMTKDIKHLVFKRHLSQKFLLCNLGLFPFSLKMFWFGIN